MLDDLPSFGFVSAKGCDLESCQLCNLSKKEHIVTCLVSHFELQQRRPRAFVNWRSSWLTSVSRQETCMSRRKFCGRKTNQVQTYPKCFAVFGDKETTTHAVVLNWFWTSKSTVSSEM